MSKKVLFTDVEIYTSPDNVSTENFFGFIQDLVDNLESDLSKDDENFQFTLQSKFAPNKNPKYNLHINGLHSVGTRHKVIDVLKRTARIFGKDSEGTVQVTFKVQDD